MNRRLHHTTLIEELPLQLDVAASVAVQRRLHLELVVVVAVVFDAAVCS